MSRLNVDTTLSGDSNERYSFMETPLEMHPQSHQRELSSPTPADSSAPPEHPATDEPQKTRQRAWSYAPSEKEVKLQHQGIMPDYTNCPPLEQHPANYAPLVQAQQRQQRHQSQLQHSASMPLQLYSNASEDRQYGTEDYAQSYTNLAQPQHDTMSPRSYTPQPYTKISEQQHQGHQQSSMSISPQYAHVPEQSQHAVPMPPHSNSHVGNPYETQSYIDFHEQQRATQTSSQPYFSYTEPPVSPPSSPGPLPLKALNPDASSQSEAMTIGPDSNPLQSPKSPYFPPPTRAAASHAPSPDDLSAYHQPGQTPHPNQEVMGGGWSNGLCELSNFGICCLGLICPCILYGRTQHRLSMKSRKEDPTNILGYETCNGSCTAMGLLCGCQWLLATVQHTRTRKTYGIQGTIASDCVRASCFTCCTLIQDEKEIQKREETRARAARERGTTLLSPYITPAPMSYGASR
ncbi:hypothetical protein N7457_004224 [Penicillium paradoxum]|uniref:uncharacterized protein n=1 Tax=Penicillium paradoxum TaxID=176176 RepID=UPI002549C127|nr:uncharacterized protein N7457_004224 [Penicillium paradoxum]KAJ5782450.1 hypothetical protein N7457_004224 [Penicillium paradoxum]